MKLSYRAIGVVGALLVMGSGSPAGGAHTVTAQDVPTVDGPRISTARFWRGERGTLLEGLVGLPISAQAAGPAEVTLLVRDAAGQVLHTETWVDSVSERLAALARTRPGAEVTSPLSVGLTQGRYTITLSIKRGVTVDSVRETIEGFTSQPLLSDVIVSSRIRSLAEGEEPGPAETRKGRVAIERATIPKILPTDPSLWYYLELYPTGGATQELEYTVVRATGGEPLVRTQRTMQVGERGGVDAARLIVQGLPPGEYKLVVTAKAGDRTERREAAFEMGSLADAPVLASSPAGGGEAALLEKYFSAPAVPDSIIRHAIDALTLVSPGEAVSGSTRQLPIDAQRRFLARYWSRIADPAPGTQQHELLEEYMGRVAHVAREFSERSGQPGARTARGRIYLKYGPPDVKQIAPMSGNRAVELWKYTRTRSVKFAFLDETGFQNFVLVYTNDPNDQGVADWQDRIADPATIRMILGF